MDIGIGAELELVGVAGSLATLVLLPTIGGAVPHVQGALAVQATIDQVASGQAGRAAIVLATPPIGRVEAGLCGSMQNAKLSPFAEPSKSLLIP